MKLLVTGGTGFLGAHLIPRLLDAGHDVRLLGRSDPPAALSGKVELVKGDLTAPETLERALDGIDAVYHLAGRVDFDPKDGGRAMYALHVDGTRRLLERAAEAKVGRVILASTSGAIGVSREERVATEEDDYPIETVGRWPYYLSKIYEEKLALSFCRERALPLVVLNPALLLGPGDARLSSTWTVVKHLQRDLPAMPNGGISFVDVRDAADAFVAALEHGEPYGRHLLGVNLRLADFFKRLESISGVAAPRLRLPKTANVLGARLLEKVADWRGVEPAVDAMSVEIAEHWFWVDSSKAERLLGFRARDVHETLYDTVKDIRGRGVTSLSA